MINEKCLALMIHYNEDDMKTISVLIIMFCLSTHTPALADEQWTIEKIYSYFETHHSPKEFLHFTQEAALYVSGQCKKSKIACDKVLSEFSKPSKWGILDVKHFHVNIIDIETWNLVAHPNPAFHRFFKVKGIGKIVKDHNGRLFFYFGVNGIKNEQPKGFFFSKYTTYEGSVTKIKEPMHMLSLFVLIPGTTMVTSANYPYRAKSTEELDKVAAKLNSLVEEWSIIKGK